VTVASERAPRFRQAIRLLGTMCLSDAPPLVRSYALMYLEGGAGHDR
jgi:hypothetical protein